MPDLLSPALIGPDYIRDFARKLPNGPGVYRMLDHQGKVLYVGKAKNLKNRVSSYVNERALSSRILTMMNHTRAMEVIETVSEAEALLVEANLIKKLEPRYNILLKDDKSYPFIRLTDHEFPRLVKHRGAQKKGETYFGPFASAGAVNQAIATLHRVFLLRPCPDTIFRNRSRPCLQYQIKRCSAPCVRLVDEAQYSGQVDEAKRFLSGKSRQVQDALLARMQQASNAERFEEAGTLRDRLRVMTQLQNQQGLSGEGLEDADIVALHRDHGAASIQVFFFRGGQNFGNRSFFPAVKEEHGASEIMEAFLGQFYQTHGAPRQVILSHDVSDPALLEDALSLSTRYRVKLLVPQKGEKRQVVDQALKNAETSLALHLAERSSQSKLLLGFAEVFGLAEPPKRIEVYDNSHTGGTNAVGGLISAGPEGFQKQYYRRFTIKNQELTPGDDYGMMREVLTRRLSRLQKEDPEKQLGMWPDFLLIDGGQGHLQVVAEVMEEEGISDLCYATIAKGVDRNAGREWFHLPGREPFQLPPNTPVLHYIQRLRDEAHRFAITTHRAKRSKAIVVSVLDQIPGIGAGRKKALLHHFGSSRGVEAASLDDLAKVPGLNRKTAQQIYDYFHV